MLYFVFLIMTEDSYWFCLCNTHLLCCFLKYPHFLLGNSPSISFTSPMCPLEMGEQYSLGNGNWLRGGHMKQRKNKCQVQDFVAAVERNCPFWLWSPRQWTSEAAGWPFCHAIWKVSPTMETAGQTAKLKEIKTDF